MEIENHGGLFGRFAGLRQAEKPLEPHVREDDRCLIDRLKESRMRALKVLDRGGQAIPGGLEQLGLLLRPAGLMSRGIEKMRDAARVLFVTAGEGVNLLAQGRDQLQKLLPLGFGQTGRLLDPRLDLPHSIFHHPVTSGGRWNLSIPYNLFCKLRT